jgi:hypothetical protein
LKELQPQPVFEKRISNYKLNGHKGLQQAIKKYQPTEKREAGRQLKELLNCYIEIGTGHEA